MVLSKADESRRIADDVPPPPQPTSFESFQPAAKSIAVAPTQSRAIPIWIALICLVLGSLFMQTRSSQPSYNLLIEGNALADGADVLLDGQKVGHLSLRKQSQVKVIGLRLNVADGQHRVEVLKADCQPFSRQLSVRGADYLGVELKKK